MQSTCRLAWGVIFDRGTDRGIVLCLLYFWRGWECTCVYVCVYAHTHTHCTWGTRREPMGRDETPGGPEELWARWTKSRHICILGYVQSTHVYIYVGRCMLVGGMRSEPSAFLFKRIFLPKKLSKNCQRSTENSNLSYIDPQSRLLNYLF